MKKILLNLALVVGLAGCNATGTDMNMLMANVGKGGETIKNVTAKEMTPSEEAEAGAASAALLLGGAPLYKNAEVERYVNQVGTWIAMQTGRSDIQWRFGVLDTNDVDAFAAPSGYVLITRGLLVRLNNESELAGVLGHEITHVVKRHYVYAYLKAQRSSGLKQGAELYIDNTKGSTADKELIKTLANGFRGVYVSGLSKDDEYEADRTGVVYAARAGYDPYGMPRVLSMYAASDKADAFSLLAATHPASADRLEALGKAMGDNFAEYETKGVRDTKQFKRIVALAKR